MEIVLIGAGNVGYHLGKKLKEAGEEVVQVFSRKRYKANKLAKLIGAKSTTNLDRILINADLYIIAVHDDGIRDIGLKLAMIGCHNKLVVHTSGATPKSIFENTGLTRFGIFYPLQTFSFSKEPDFNKIPFCIDANTIEDISFLKKMAGNLSPIVHLINDDQKTLIHVAAVFVNNFTNHIFHIAAEILNKENIPFKILLPLMEETLDKVKKNTPKDMQTGPAVRGDEATIKRHLKLLESNDSYKTIYKLLTKSIQEVSKN